VNKCGEDSDSEDAELKQKKLLIWNWQRTALA